MENKEQEPQPQDSVETESRTYMLGQFIIRFEVNKQTGHRITHDTFADGLELPQDDDI